VFLEFLTARDVVGAVDPDEMPVSRDSLSQLALNCCVQGNALVETSIGALLQFPDGLFGNSYPNPITSELPVIQAQPREARPTGCEQGHCSRPYSKVVSGGL
jgi:hypothetical protein